MATKKKPDPTTLTIDYIASKVNKMASKKGKSIIQFTLTVVITPGGSFTFKNCIAGIGKKGAWVTPSLVTYRPFAWNQEFSDMLIKNLQTAGYFDDIVPAWTEEEGGEIKW